MKKNYIQPTVDQIDAIVTQTLMASDKGADLQGGGDSSSGIPLGSGVAARKVPVVVH